LAKSLPNLNLEEICRAPFFNFKLVADLTLVDLLRKPEFNVFSALRVCDRKVALARLDRVFGCADLGVFGRVFIRNFGHCKFGNINV
jgi:hypothetical protein